MLLIKINLIFEAKKEKWKKHKQIYCIRLNLFRKYFCIQTYNLYHFLSFWITNYIIIVYLFTLRSNLITKWHSINFLSLFDAILLLMRKKSKCHHWLLCWFFTSSKTCLPFDWWSIHLLFIHKYYWYFIYVFNNNYNNILAHWIICFLCNNSYFFPRLFLLFIPWFIRFYFHFIHRKIYNKATPTNT